MDPPPFPRDLTGGRLRRARRARRAVSPPKLPANMPVRRRCHPTRRGTRVAPTCLSAPELRRLTRVARVGTIDTLARYRAALRIAGERQHCASRSDPERCVVQQVLGVSPARVFAPDAPASWTRNPQEWTTNDQIMAVLRQYAELSPDVLLLPFATADFNAPDSETGSCHNPELCNFQLERALAQGKKHLVLLLNKDKWDGEGTHWVAFYGHLPSGLFVYFDSLGDGPPRALGTWVTKRRLEWNALRRRRGLKFVDLTLVVNTVRHQERGSNCGIYAIFFLVSMLTPTYFLRRGQPDDLETKIRYFTDKSKRDLTNESMQRWRSVFFNVPKDMQA